MRDLCLGVLLVAYQRAAAGHSVDMLSEAFAALGSVLLLAALTVVTVEKLIEPAALTDRQLAAGIRPIRAGVVLDLMFITVGLYALVILTKLASRVGVRGTHGDRRVERLRPRSPCEISRATGSCVAGSQDVQPQTAKLDHRRPELRIRAASCR